MPWCPCNTETQTIRADRNLCFQPLLRPQQHPKTLLTPRRVQESLQQGGSAVNGDSSTLPMRCGRGKQHRGTKDAETVPVPGPVPAQSPLGASFGPCWWQGARLCDSPQGSACCRREAELGVPSPCPLWHAGGGSPAFCAVCHQPGAVPSPSTALAAALRRGAKSAEPSPAATSTPSTPSTPSQMDVSSLGWCRQARLGARAAK